MANGKVTDDEVFFALFGYQTGQLAISAELMMLAVARGDFETATRYVDLVREPIDALNKLRRDWLGRKPPT